MQKGFVALCKMSYQDAHAEVVKTGSMNPKIEGASQVLAHEDGAHLHDRHERVAPPAHEVALMEEQPSRAACRVDDSRCGRGPGETADRL